MLLLWLKLGVNFMKILKGFAVKASKGKFENSVTLKTLKWRDQKHSLRDWSKYFSPNFRSLIFQTLLRSSSHTWWISKLSSFQWVITSNPICFCFMSSYQFSIYVRSDVVTSNQFNEPESEWKIQILFRNEMWHKYNGRRLVTESGGTLLNGDCSAGHIPMEANSAKRTRFDTDKRFLVGAVIILEVILFQPFISSVVLELPSWFHRNFRTKHKKKSEEQTRVWLSEGENKRGRSTLKTIFSLVC